MPIISPIGRKHPRVRLLIGLIYLLLIVGGLTMIYPFALMLAGSTKSGVDVRDLNLIPAYIHNDETLYRKYIEGLFNESLDMYRTAYDRDDRSFESVALPTPGQAVKLADWQDYLAQADLPDYARVLGFVHTRISLTTPHMLRTFKGEMYRRFDRDIQRMNRALGTDFVNWNAFFVLPEDYYARLRAYTEDPFQQAFREFKAEQDWTDWHVASIQGFYRNRYLPTRFGRDIARFNEAHSTVYPAYDAIPLTRRQPATTPAEQRTWEGFVRQTLNGLWVRVDDDAAPDYHAYLAARYGHIDRLNYTYRSAYDEFAAVPLPGEARITGARATDWDAFLRGWEDPDTGAIYQPSALHLSIDAPDFWFQDYLAAQYGTITALNSAWNTSYQDFGDITMPQQAAHFDTFLQQRAQLRWEFTIRNYLAVMDYLFFHGRGMINTAIYCTLAVLLALLVNPMAAYAMSRYRMPSTYKILLFLLLTMAFPPIVTQIPVFLMLRDFNLLNTFAALVLPGMAHGYSIFLLKGFFDSLPRELYESAEIDGANEWIMFWHISMSLSKPILAVIALNAFTQAYSNFMFALLICQDEEMWTLMVWLYQLQMRSGQGVIYASLILAAIPTFIIFFFCQHIILRGIVVPVEK